MPSHLKEAGGLQPRVDLIGGIQEIQAQESACVCVCVWCAHVRVLAHMHVCVRGGKGRGNQEAGGNVCSN